jgi:DNA-binding transcriptional regulator WhiA
MKETIRLRERYPELTLSELAQEFDPPVTKSCLNHRLRKVLELARGLESKETEETTDGPL